MARKLKCGCTPDASGYGYCGECTAALRAKIRKTQTQEQYNYDNWVRNREIESFDKED